MIRYLVPAPGCETASPDASGVRCSTCGDVAIEGEVVRLLAGDCALVATAAGTRVMSVALVDASVGDVLLFHADEAIGMVR